MRESGFARLAGPFQTWWPAWAPASWNRPSPPTEGKAMANSFVWVDIPVLKLDRAIRFYSAVIGMEVEKNEYPGMTIGTFPHKDGEVGGCLYISDTVKPSADGPLVY